MTFTAEELATAAKLVYQHVPPTPQHRWPLLRELTGVDVWVKHENHTPTGAFKVRGGIVYADRLQRERPHVAGLVSATTGNHGQSLAFAGRAFDIPVTIVAPRGNSPGKNAAMRGFGAELIEHGDDFQLALEHARQLSAERNLELVPPFHKDLVLGVATYAYELFTAVPALDVVYVPVGMGSGISGLIGVRDLLGLPTKIVGVVSAGAPAMALSFGTDHVVTTSTADTFVDGVATRTPDAAAVEIVWSGAARILEVSDDECAAAMRAFFDATRNAPEPAGALALAGLLTEREAVQGKRVAIIQSGGNVDVSTLTQVLSGGTPTRR